MDPTTAKRRERRGILAVIGPGLLVAATGVGAGDLYTAGFAGNRLGPAVLWAVVLGAALKLVVTEGLARWQLATGTTLLEGCVFHLGRPFQVVFALYLVTWSYFVGAALISACGVTLHALLPLFATPEAGKLVLGLACSATGAAIALAGGFAVFERVMAGCIGLMFVTVSYTALVLDHDWSTVAIGLVVPRIPELGRGGLEWTVALIGGVGGTLTVLCYGYWMREQGREGPGELRTTRLDLAAGYAMTMLFGIAMVLIGSRVAGTGKGAAFVVSVAAALAQAIGPAGRWLFLLGAFGAVFSSLLGVWQSVPYLFADFVALVLGEDARCRRRRVQTRSHSYRLYLLLLATVPALALRFPFQSVQRVYAIFGALFVPFLAAVLLYLMRSARVGALANRPAVDAALVVALALFAVFGWMTL